MVVFDFDKTILDVDSDNWVVDELGATAVFDQLLNTMPWNTLMVSKINFGMSENGTRTIIYVRSFYNHT